jgi:hypothetical protein
MKMILLNKSLSLELKKKIIAIKELKNYFLEIFRGLLNIL